MAAEKAANNGQNGMQNEIRAAFGQVNVENDTSTQKTPIMSFSNGNVYIGLKLVSTFDQKNNVRREPVPRITASFNGKFVEVPLNGKSELHHQRRRGVRQGHDGQVQGEGMSEGYRVDHWFLWGNGELRSKTYRYPTYEEALERFDRCSEDESSTRVALRKIGPKRSSSALKVWEAPL